MKVVALILCCLFLAGCSAPAGVSQEEFDALKSQYEEALAEIESLKAQLEPVAQVASEAVLEPPAASIEEDELTAQLSSEWFQYTDIIDTRWAAIVVTNNSDYLLEISAYATFLQSGEMVGVDEQSERAVSPGASVALTLMTDAPFDDLEYELSAKPEEHYGDAVSHLSCEVSEFEEKAIISVTNNGDAPAEFVNYTALFFLDGQLISHDTGYTIDDDDQLKPGKTLSAEARCRDGYDEVRVFLTGRID